MLFSTTKSILLKNGASRDIPSLVSRLGGTKTLIVTDNGILNFGLLDSCLQAFKEEKKGGEVVIFSDVTPDPTEDNVSKAVEVAMAEGCDVVVGFGGGSSMDVAKVVAHLCHGDVSKNTVVGDYQGMYGVEQIGNARLPLIQVPTTAGTGSEVTPISILTNAAKLKQGIVSSTLLPDFAVLDGSLTVTVPATTTAHTGVDAMVHAIEAYTCRTKKNPLSDLLSLEALRILSGNIRTAVKNGANEDARGQMLYGSMLAGMAFANSPVGGVHALAYPLGGMFGVPHGMSCSLMLPPVMRYNSTETKCAEMYGGLGEVIFPELKEDLRGVGGERAANLVVENVEEMIEELGLPSKLSDFGVKETDLEMMASEAMKQTRLLPNNPRDISGGNAVGIYSSIL
ncbi:hypothetical protein TL16_g00242 [Triparma laevis f. inornata]|uniref:Alcohol dehydrogenase 4 n=1 Tax=Triparma laevis f. inornata TaxID=1714386 RepID=A0A9W7DM85_9STRA|nr:hypothetical protein TL16_g00242 [Triparma laevis f. inornata]